MLLIDTDARLATWVPRKRMPSRPPHAGQVWARAGFVIGHVHRDGAVAGVGGHDAAGGVEVQCPRIAGGCLQQRPHRGGAVGGLAVDLAGPHQHAVVELGRDRHPAAVAAVPAVGGGQLGRCRRGGISGGVGDGSAAVEPAEVRFCRHGAQQPRHLAHPQLHLDREQGPLGVSRAWPAGDAEQTDVAGEGCLDGGCVVLGAPPARRV